MKGEPWQIMYTNVVKLLERSVFLHQFPCTREEAVGPALPGEVKRAGLAWDNARMAMKWERYSQCRIDINGNVILFWVAENEEGGNHEHWPTPVDIDDGFIVDVAHPRHAQIGAWAVGAMELDDWISGSKVYLNRVLKTMKHPTWVERFWPQIVPYVGTVPEILVKGMREPRPTSLQLDMALQDEIQNKLTLAALLPKDQELRAWVGRYQ